MAEPTLLEIDRKIRTLLSSTPYSNNVSSNASDSDRDSNFEEFLEDVFEFKPSTDIDLELICQEDNTHNLLRTFQTSLKQSEPHRYKPFTNLVNHISSAIAVQKGGKHTIFARPHNTFTLRGSSGATRLPDVVFTSRPEDSQCNPLHWSDVKLVLDFKAKSDGVHPFSISRGDPASVPSAASSALSGASTGSKRRRGVSSDNKAPNKYPRTWASDANMVAAQLTSYTLESFFHGPYRSHVVHGMVLGSTLQLWYYDRVGVVRSDGVDFVKNLVPLAQFLVAIAHLSEASWGLHPIIAYPSLAVIPRSLRPHPEPLTPNPSDDQGFSSNAESSDIESDGSAHDSSYQPAPESRLLCAEPFVGATIEIEHKTFVLGTCIFRQYTLTGRGTCVIEANDGAVVVKLSWPEEARTPEYTFLGKAYLSADKYGGGKYANMKKYLPILEAKGDFGACGPRSRIRARRGAVQSSGRSGLRILRVTVYEKLLPMTDIRTAEDLMKVMRDIALCHRWLYRVMGILHRDISMNNIMISRAGTEILGVLIDYDLAVDINQTSSTTLERTGIRRFMAVDLIKGTCMPHHARHDIESMFWVLVWFSFRYEDGKEIPNHRTHMRPLEEWITSLALGQAKIDFIADMNVLPTRPFRSILRPYIAPLAELLSSGYRALSNYSQDVTLYNEPDDPSQQKLERPVFDVDALFHNDTSMWTAFWRVLNPIKPCDFDNHSESDRDGFLTQ